MSEFNPYDPPKHQTVDQDPRLLGEHGLWQDARTLVIRKGTELPDRCLRCNEPADGYRLKRTLSWHRPAWYFLIFFNIIIYLVVALFVRSTAKIAAPFCLRHRLLRRRAILIGWLGSLGGVILCGLGSSDPNLAPALVVGGILLLGSILYGVIGSQFLVPQKIDKNFLWLRKVSPEFLAMLPEWS